MFINLSIIYSDLYEDKLMYVYKVLCALRSSSTMKLLNFMSEQ